MHFRLWRRTKTASHGDDATDDPSDDRPRERTSLSDLYNARTDMMEQSLRARREAHFPRDDTPTD